MYIQCSVSRFRIYEIRTRAYLDVICSSLAVVSDVSPYSTNYVTFGNKHMIAFVQKLKMELSWGKTNNTIKLKATYSLDIGLYMQVNLKSLRKGNDKYNMSVYIDIVFCTH